MYEYHHWGPGFGAGVPGHEWLFLALAIAAPFILLFVLWAVFWKGLALWHAARRGQYWWFVILLVVNTLGILEIIYLFVVAKLKWRDLFSLHGHGHVHNRDHGHPHHH